MNTIRKILVPIDFSEDSANGLNYAVSLAEKTEAELVALHVTEKEEANSFVDLLAMIEGAPTLIHRRAFRLIDCCVIKHWTFTASSRRSLEGGAR